MSGYHLKVLRKRLAGMGIELPEYEAPTGKEEPRPAWLHEMREAMAEIGGWAPPLLTVSRRLRPAVLRRMFLCGMRLPEIARMVCSGHSYRETARALNVSHVAVRKAWLRFRDARADFERKLELGLELLSADGETRLPPRWDRRRRGQIVHGRVRIPRLPRPGWPLVTEHPGAYSDRRVLDEPVVAWREGAAFFGWSAAKPYPHWLHLTREQRFLVTYYLRQKYHGKTGRPREDFVWKPPEFGPE